MSNVKPLAANKNCEVSLIIEGHLGLARTDEGKLQQCLLNLLSNAVKFTEGFVGFMRSRFMVHRSTTYTKVRVALAG
jgi:signal transduction histidine kinase